MNLRDVANKVARDFVGFAKPKYEVGDLVKFNSRSRKVYKIDAVVAHYWLYHEETDHNTGVDSESLVRAPHMEPVTFRKNEIAKEGDKIAVTQRGETREYVVKSVRFDYDLRNTMKTNEVQYHIEEDAFIPADEKPLDKLGRDAASAAEEELGGRGGLVVIDMYRLVRERLGKILKVSPKGVLTVQEYTGGDYGEGGRNMEQYKPETKNKGDVVRFSPSLWRGEWIWSKGRELHIKRPYRKGEKLTSLLD